jgi:hypothetical protein
MQDALFRSFLEKKRLYGFCLLFVFVLWGIFSIKNLVHFGGRPPANIVFVGAATHQSSLVGFTVFLLDMIQKAAPNGDVFVKFDGPELRNDIGLFIYYYLSYSIYPRRLLVSDETAIINNTATFRQNLVVPDDAWLTQRGIEQVITLSYDSEGNLNITTRDLLKKRP